VTADPSPILIYDGVCNLCHVTIRFILAHEAHQRIRFAAVQSAAGQRLLAGFGLPAMPDSFVFVEGDAVLLRAAAAARIAAHLRMPWRLFRLLALIPRGIGDAGYGLVARNRYNLFGRRATCTLPAPEHHARFLA
jgi:predicted DCC family thiol-disulfide oxidoreductase YuxK